MKRFRPSIYTFLAVFITLLLIGAVVVPFLLDQVERTYFELHANINERQAQAMGRFVESRLEAGMDPIDVVAEFQTATTGTDVDRGYVCLIQQDDVRYLSHPSADVQGMAVKPMAVFDPNFDGSGNTLWQEYLREGQSASGLLVLGEDMPVEIVHFNALTGVNWTVSSHENTERMQAEIDLLRRWLTIGFIVFGLLIALPASFAARRVNAYFQKQLQQQHVLEQQLLKSENDRKTQELEEARALQLSMLPKSAPALPAADVAFYMNPATEVGGDYYDYVIAENGTITLAIGDATGHGLQASSLVTATKSLFLNMAASENIADILHSSSAAIKMMGFGKLFMAFAVARISGDTLELVGAGMPAALIYRHATGEVESVPLKGIPLGGFTGFNYELKRVRLEPGDTLVLMSDGFPEQFNPERDMVGYETGRELLGSTCPASPDTIISTFKHYLQTWRQDEIQMDDVTFVVYQRAQ